ncbi:unnamed protein product [Mytilus coruscus]|uniref:Uncharacterized protein n=1 Tax=Mytilus coruscus TaxID=42192 RepID=A0A6J8EVE9_MYTCO|nr:unnamed protein product [Mytilus coruscus]
MVHDIGSRVVRRSDEHFSPLGRLAHHIQKNHLKADPPTLPRTYTPSPNTTVERRAIVGATQDILPTSVQKRHQDSKPGGSIETVNLKRNIPHKTARTKNGCPWITTDIRRLIRKKDRAYKRKKKSNDANDNSKYKELKREAQKQMRKAYWRYRRHSHTKQ